MSAHGTSGGAKTSEPVDVTVLTPSFGYGRFIEDALESVRRQTGVTVQHVVQDGGSTDETLEVLERHGDAVSWRSEPDAGQSDALNRALRRARGEWVAWLNADEFYLPNALSRLVAAGRAAAADVVYAELTLVDEDGRQVGSAPQHPFAHRILRWYGCYISSCAILIRRSVLGDDPWRTDLRMLMDWELYLDLAAQGRRFAYLPEPVAAFRLHPGQVSGSSADTFRAEFAAVRGRYGIPGGLVPAGRVLHGAAKLAGGAYRRQLIARRARGRDLRWFAAAQTGVVGAARAG